MLFVVIHFFIQFLLEELPAWGFVEGHVFNVFRPGAIWLWPQCRHHCQKHVCGPHAPAWWNHMCGMARGDVGVTRTGLSVMMLREDCIYCMVVWKYLKVVSFDYLDWFGWWCSTKHWWSDCCQLSHPVQFDYNDIAGERSQVTSSHVLRAEPYLKKTYLKVM